MQRLAHGGSSSLRRSPLRHRPRRALWPSASIKTRVVKIGQEEANVTQIQATCSSIAGLRATFAVRRSSRSPKGSTTSPAGGSCAASRRGPRGTLPLISSSARTRTAPPRRTRPPTPSRSRLAPSPSSSSPRATAPNGSSPTRTRSSDTAAMGRMRTALGTSSAHPSVTSPTRRAGTAAQGTRKIRGCRWPTTPKPSMQETSSMAATDMVAPMQARCSLYTTAPTCSCARLQIRHRRRRSSQAPTSAARLCAARS